MKPLNLLDNLSPSRSSQLNKPIILRFFILLSFLVFSFELSSKPIDQSLINKNFKELLKDSNEEGTLDLNNQRSKQKRSKSKFKSLLKKSLFLKKGSSSQFNLLDSSFENIELVEHNSSKNYKSNAFKFKFQNIEVCKEEIKAQELNDKIYVLGKTNSIEDAAPINMHWPSSELAHEYIEEELNNWGQDYSSEKISKVRSCWFLKNKQLIPSVEYNVVEENNRQYSYFISSDGIISKDKKFFHIATGKISAYTKNILDGVQEEFTYTDFIGDGTLTTKHLTTSPVGAARANDDLHEFIFNTNTDEFLEAGSFAYTRNMLDFFTNLGYVWPSDEPKLVIKVNDDNGSGAPGGNGALYTSKGNQGQGASIAVGAGDGIILQNLGYEPEVFGHELGHHIMFTNGLTDASNNETVVLHEGIADYFVFSKTNNSCLAESVCPSSSSACFVNTATETCLRTGDNEFTLESDEVQAGGHLLGMVISGFLLDLTTDHGIDQDDVDKLTFGAVKEFASQSGYHDFVLALLIADKDLFNGKHTQAIYNEAIERGFASFITDIPCNATEGCDSSELPLIIATDGTTDGNTTSSSQSREKSSSCGVVHMNSQQNNPYLLMIMLFGLPLIFASFFIKSNTITNHES